MPSAGEAPVIPADSNASTALVAEAVRTGTHPERVSPLVTPPPFDAAAYARDPAAYLTGSEPGRPWQTAQPGADVPVLRRGSPLPGPLRQGDAVDLVILAPPGAPVSATVLDLGLFSNGLQAITVRADDQGRATIRFRAVPGSVGIANLIAGSPMASGQLRYRLFIRDPGAS